MFHVLRHTYASTQLEAGESIVSVSEWLGHASPQTTLKHYAHFMPEAGKRGLAAMDEWFEQGPQDSQPNVPEKSLGASQSASGL
ncbi:tyrosine-type recombinase/integrase [Streptomyces sp. YGL11-2]|uniref:tyrosine-type recombinase/integrase n=1 Tax=Streptomyces sp. YGL11-2 TaxID=3414028 RepID=UPI003CEA9331